jgi:hypothetical protein
MKPRLVKFPSRPSVLDRAQMSERRRRTHDIAERLASVEDRCDLLYGHRSTPFLLELIESLVTKTERLS